MSKCINRALCVRLELHVTKLLLVPSHVCGVFVLVYCNQDRNLHGCVQALRPFTQAIVFRALHPLLRGREGTPPGERREKKVASAINVIQ